VHLRDEEFEALHEAARQTGRSVAALVRQAIRQARLRPESDGPVAETSLEDLVGCAGYKGPAKSLKEMNDGVGEGAWKRQ